MKVYYISGLQVSGSKILGTVRRLYQEVQGKEIDYLVLCGDTGISMDTTESFISSLVQYFQDRIDTKVRFLPGGSDFYPSGNVTDKGHYFRYVMGRYMNHPNCLITHPVLQRYVHIFGFFTWYDYSLYTGKPISLKNITNKSFLGIPIVHDTNYFTNKDDYLLGMGNTIDCQLVDYSVTKMDRELQRSRLTYSEPVRKIIVGYHFPTMGLLKRGFLQNYKNAFVGSSVYEHLLKKYGVTDYIVGSKMYSDVVHFRGIQYKNCRNGTYEEYVI